MARIILLSIAFVLVVQFNFTGTKTYKIGCNENYYPYISKNPETDELEGIIIDWWNLWAEKTGYTVEFVPLDLGGCLEKIETGEIDAIASLFFSEKRAENLLFSEPLMRMKTVLFLKNDSKPESIKRIENKVAVLENDLSVSFLQENHPEVELDIFDDFYELQSLVQRKKIAGFVYDIPDPIRNYKAVKSPKGYYMFQTLYSQSLRPVVKMGNDKMLNEIIAGAVQMSEEEILEIAEQWDFFKPNRSVFWILLMIGIVFGILLALFINNLVSSRKKMRVLEDNLSKTDWQLIIDKGENDHIEFKSSLRWDLRLKKANKILERVIAKTISAFLNAHGGMLFIGVDDDGNILGLDDDYKCLSKSNRDGFLLSLTNVINVHLGKSVHKFLSINIISINDKDVCIVNIEPCDKPTFMGKNDNEEFYIRASASSQPLGVRETYKYINSHWSK